MKQQTMTKQAKEAHKKMRKSRRASRGRQWASVG